MSARCVETAPMSSVCRRTYRTPDAPYLADRWCDCCIANAALEGERIESGEVRA